ncbi:G2/mitotic-specific cyclin-A isoform X2 [Ischnura elegans]|uniref:G2/mitotic-specific cyclin-A isoform X2 n=1 Tax=Ischnura elegans TaxID=197161 RepID=UPI001ED89988|nr:G2/mitotic-specific cyclin-A isoform X2 [Ischnura elegans]
MASFQIHEDQENRGIGGRRLKKQVSNVSLESKRTALGVISLPTNNINAQKGKQSLGGENACLKSKLPFHQRKAPVKVREDPPQKTTLELKPSLKVSVASTSTRSTASLKSEIDVIGKEKNVFEDQILSTSKGEEPMSEGEQYSPMRIDKSLDNAVEKSKPDCLFYVEEYKHEIHMHLRQIEVVRRPKAGYMKKQPDINFSMRSILVDWLVEVTEEYKMDPETLYLAVSYIDRFLSFMSVVKANLQLVGTAAMFIAAKYEEIYPPELSEFVYLTDDTYSKAQVLKMENLMLKVLCFDLSVPTALCFIKKYCLETQATDNVKSLAMYLSELTLLEGDPFLKFLPSEIACSAIAIARHNFGMKLWDEELELTTGYVVDEFKTCLTCLHETFTKAPKYPQKAVYDKYKVAKWHSVSLLTPLPLPC